MKAVFIAAIVNFEFRLPLHPLSLSALSFHTLNCCWFFQHDLCLPFFLRTFTGAMPSITFLNFELNESRRRSTESAEMLGVKDIAFINSAVLFSSMYLFLTETDLDSVVIEINISKKIPKWSDNATSLITMDEMFDLYWWVNLECVLDCVWVHAHAESSQKCLEQL